MPISPESNPGNQILARYLPPLPNGIAADWIESQSLKGKLVLDPFGSAPDLSVEAARSGARVIVTANNPITRLLLEVAAHPPIPSELRTVLSALATIRVRDERLEPLITALYQTGCPNCGGNIGAEAFLWEREAPSPYARIVHCPLCHEMGEFPATEADIQNARKFSGGGLHRSRALERVAPLNDPDRVHVEEALNVYPPRAIYALLTLVNKLDVLDLSPEQERYLAAILLSAFDQANTLWPHPIARERPRQLTIPPTYRENNIWLALELAMEQLAANDESVPITYWPILPPEEGGICIFESRIRDLAEQLAEIELGAVLTAFPRPNQAFWSLSALWAGWLWGHETVEHFKGVLRRRRYDWAWHTTAIQAALESLKPAITEGLPIFGIIGESEPGFTTAILLAAFQADLQLEDFTLLSEKKITKIHWKAFQHSCKPEDAANTLSDTILNSGQDYLIARGEPSNYLQLHTAILEDICRQNLFPTGYTPADSYTQTQQEIQSMLDFRHGFLRFGGSEKSLDVGQWWLVDDRQANTPLADRVEMAVVNYLIQHPRCSLDEIEAGIQSQFPGVLTPESTLICECLESYGENLGVGWNLREQDAPSKRREELSLMVDIISGMGKKLGFNNESHKTKNPYCIWIDQAGVARYAFYISASAMLGKFLVEQDPSPARGIIAIPGGRANLVMFKLRRDPRLQKIFEQGWQFLKYRQARQLANSATLTAENLEANLGLDPLTYSETQMRMF